MHFVQINEPIVQNAKNDGHSSIYMGLEAASRTNPRRAAPESAEKIIHIFRNTYQLVITSAYSMAMDGP